MTFENRFWLTAALCAPLCMGAKECRNQDAETVCKYDGKVYAEGDAFPSKDHCNSCSCRPSGAVSCTNSECLATCEHEGKTYLETETFLSTDGCNTCSCTRTGVACTEKACVDGGRACDFRGASYAHGASVPSEDICNSCRCKDGSVFCTDVSCESDLPSPLTPSRGCALGDTEFALGASVICQDGCNHCTCGADAASSDAPSWISTRIGCPALPKIEVCDGAKTDAALAVKPLYLADDALALEVQTGGGCEEHPMRLCTDGSFLESNPVQLDVWLVDDGKPDSCDAMFTKEFAFDVSPLKKLYSDGYEQDAGTIILRVDGNSVDYTF